MFCTQKRRAYFYLCYFSMSGQLLVLARICIIRIYLGEDYYVIRLVDSVWVPSTCSFLRCSATCSAVGKEWSHFGHVKPVSDIKFDWTILNKNFIEVLAKKDLFQNMRISSDPLVWLIWIAKREKNCFLVMEKRGWRTALVLQEDGWLW